jgi:alkylresorcinol/alkylpyrone synthase
MSTPVALLGLGSAVPRHRLDQTDVERRARDIFGSVFTRYPQLLDIFVNAGIERRYSVAPIEWFDIAQGWNERTKVYLEGASALFCEAAARALAQAGLAARDVDVIVTVSSTGIATPSIEARVSHDLGFRSDVMRVPVFGLGCAGGVSGLAIASRLVRAEPGAIVLMVAVELCTLAFRRDRAAKADVVATALFGDGAAAAVLQAASPRAALARIGDAGEHTWPRTLDIMGWAVDPTGFGVVLSRALPRFVEEKLATPARNFMKSATLDQYATRFICHPGGAKVLSAIETALELAPGNLAEERGILRDYGNMSAPSVLFVLERALSKNFTGNAILAALGPGFTASFLAIEAGNG